MRSRAVPPRPARGVGAARGARGLLLVAVLPLLAACPAVYPELSTPVRKPPPGRPLSPEPPGDVFRVKFKAARITPRLRDGRLWREAGRTPDVVARLLVNGVEVLSARQSGTLEPTFPEGAAPVLRLGADDALRFELWDAGALHDRPLGFRDFGRLRPEHLTAREVRVETSGDCEVVLAVDPPEPLFGIGLFYELRGEGTVFVSRVLSNSPASRAGLASGDEIVSIAGRATREMKEGEAQGHLAAPRLAGVSLSVRKRDGRRLDVLLKEGPIYTTSAEAPSVDR